MTAVGLVLIFALIVTALMAVGTLSADLFADWWRRR